MGVVTSLQVHEFVDRVKAWAPQRRRQLEQWLNVKVGGRIRVVP
jgi:hypothetical protein